ncbi:MAG: excinuclease ABC subunit UvrA [Candidatus Obscuribacterales bacterium]|nr:excinuclease ABC subunit UvrA [Candidatus Obscuribacterales bacterium]
MKKTQTQILTHEHGSQLEGFVRVKSARQNNLKSIDVDIPRDAFVAFTGVSGSGKSSIAFGTIYAEAQRRYFESIAPYARRLISQLPAPNVMEIQGLPPAVALQQRRGEPTARSSVGTLTNLSNSLRMLFSRAGVYPHADSPRLDSDAFSPNTLAGACESCHGMGVVHTVSESSLVPDPTLSISQKAVAAWPGAWQGKNYRDILAVLGYDIEKPWKDLPKEERDWILFTEEKPIVTVHAQREAHRIQRPYQGTYMSAAVYVRHTFGTTNSATLRKRVAQFMDVANCTVCHGKRLKTASLAVKFAGHDIAQLTQISLGELYAILATSLEANHSKTTTSNAEVAKVLTTDLMERIALLKELGLDYLSMNRTTQTLSAGELQRLRLTTQLKSGLFGVVYVLDEPSAGLHPQDAEALLRTLWQLKSAGNSLFVVEHEMDIVRQADWLVDIGPDAGDNGGDLLYSGPVSGLESVESSQTRRFLFDNDSRERHTPRITNSWFTLRGVNRHNLKDFSVDFPLGALTVVTGVSGSGKSTLVSQVLTETLKSQLGCLTQEEGTEEDDDEDEDQVEYSEDVGCASVQGIESLRRLVSVDQKPIGRTPRSNLATYTGLFDYIRKRFASTVEAKAQGYNAGRFSFNVVGGRCTTCDGEGFVSVELMFLPSVYTPCAGCHGTRYNEDTLAIKYRGLNISQVLDMTVDNALKFFTELPAVARALKTLSEVGLGYLRLGQPATELSGGEAQRIKLATELQRVQDGSTLYVLDEPTTGLHPADVEKLMMQLHALVEGGNTVIVVEHDMDVVAQADWVIDLGPGAGQHGGKLVANGTPQVVATSTESRTAPFLRKTLQLS